jgi:hypothetical protein
MKSLLLFLLLLLGIIAHSQTPIQLNQYNATGRIDVKANSVYWLTARPIIGQPPLVGAGLYKSTLAQPSDSIFEVYRIKQDLGFIITYTDLHTHLYLSKEEPSAIFTPLPAEPENYRLYTLTNNVVINPLTDSVAFFPNVTAPASRISYLDAPPSLNTISESINGSMPTVVVQEDSTINNILADNNKLYWQLNNHHIFKRENAVNTEVVNDLLYYFTVKDNALMYKQGSFGPIYFNDGNTMYTMPTNNEPTVGYDIIDNQRAFFTTGTADSNYQHHIYNIATGHHFIVSNNDSTRYRYASYNQHVVFFEYIDTTGSINPYVTVKYMHADSSNLVTTGPALYVDVQAYTMDDCSIYFVGRDSANMPMNIWQYNYYGTTQEISSLNNANAVFDMKVGYDYLFWTEFNIALDRVDVFSLPITHCLDTDVPEQITGKQTIKLYPNPVVNNVTIQLPYNSSGNIIITDVTGRTVMAMQANAETVQVPITGWAQGMYFVTYNSNKGRATSKLIVE